MIKQSNIEYGRFREGIKVVRSSLEEKAAYFISRLEGYSPAVYLDAASKRTIGYGHQLYQGEEMEKVDLRRAQDLLLIDVKIAINALENNFKAFPVLRECQKIALISFIFNIGQEQFKKSTLLKMLNEGKLSEVPSQMKRWVYIKHIPNRGLINRRDKEVAMWCGDW